MRKTNWFNLLFVQIMITTAVFGLQPRSDLPCQRNSLPDKPGIRNGCECAGGDEGVCEKYETDGARSHYYKYSSSPCDGVVAAEVYNGWVKVYQAPCLKLPICGCPDPASTHWKLTRTIVRNEGRIFRSCIPIEVQPCYPSLGSGS